MSLRNKFHLFFLFRINGLHAYWDRLPIFIFEFTLNDMGPFIPHKNWITKFVGKTDTVVWH